METEQVLFQVVREQVEEWAAVAAGDEWEETVLAQVREVTVFAQAAEQGSLISEAHPAIL